MWNAAEETGLPLCRIPDSGWLLMDVTGESISGGGARPHTGRIFDERGVLVAGLIQESLFRRTSRRRPKTTWRL